MKHTRNAHQLVNKLAVHRAARADFVSALNPSH